MRVVREARAKVSFVKGVYKETAPKEYMFNGVQASSFRHMVHKFFCVSPIHNWHSAGRQAKANGV